MKEVGWFAVIAGAIIFEVATAPGSALTGQSWKISRSGDPGKVQLTLQRAHLGGHMTTSSPAPLSGFRGFSPDMLDRSGPAKFEYVQDAAILQCVGRFGWGRGSGSFTLTPNPEFVTALNGLGFGMPREEQLFTMLLSNVSLDYARAVHDSGMGASLEQLIDLRQHDVSLTYMRDVERAGYGGLRAEEYIGLKDHGITANYLRDLHEAGYDLRVRDVVELKDHGVTAKFADELKEAGYNLTAGQIVELATHGIDSSFVRGLKFYGLHPTAADMVQLRQHGISPEYMRGFKEAGVTSVNEVVELQEHGVPTGFATEALQLGYRFNTRELMDLRQHGVDAAYLRRLHDSGMQNLTEAQITQLKMHGVD